VDYGITNILNHYDSTYNALKEDESLSSVDEAYYLSNVEAPELDVFFWFCFSLDADQLNQYFDIELDESVIEKLKDEDTPYVIFPIKYHYLNELQVGDLVYLNINKTYPNEGFIVAGFMDWGINEMIITNMNVSTDYQEFKPNAILINSDKQGVLENLIDDYSKNLYYMIDFDEMIDQKIAVAENITHYVSYMIIIMVVCFMLTIFNNSLIELTKMETTYARIRVLGCSSIRLIGYLMMEKLLMLVVTIISIVMFLNMMANNIPFLMLFFGTYEPFSFNLQSIILAFVVGSIMYGISCLYYFYKISQIKISDVLKNF